MFSGAAAFNQNISSWNTAKVSSMYDMFHQATAFNQNIGGWNTASFSSMGGVCAVSAGARNAADALGRSSMLHGRVTGGTARVCMHGCKLARMCVRACVCVRVRVCPREHLALHRSYTSLHIDLEMDSIYIQYMHIHPGLYAFLFACERRAPRRTLHHIRARVCASMRACVCAHGVCERTRIRTECTSTSRRRRPRAVDSQAFVSATAFNANIGAWNTARVTSFSTVCAVSAGACSPADALGRSVGVCMRGCACQDVRARMCVCVCACVYVCPREH
jgi:surface protein